MTPEQVQEVWSMLDRDYLRGVAQRAPEPIFATVSGAHLYGFASPDSDVDLRGAFLLPAHAVLGMHPPDETITIEDKSRIDLDWVAHDVRKFARLMTHHNGYVLEQLFSPLMVLSTATFEELRELGRGCITRPTFRHYQGFARGRARKGARRRPRRKPPSRGAHECRGARGLPRALASCDRSLGSTHARPRPRYDLRHTRW